MPEEDLYSSEYWKLKFIYFNPENPRIFVPKRIGIGWTINMGRWQSFIMIGVIICIIVAIRFLIKK